MRLIYLVEELVLLKLAIFHDKQVISIKPTNSLNIRLMEQIY